MALPASYGFGAGPAIDSRFTTQTSNGWWENQTGSNAGKVYGNSPGGFSWAFWNADIFPPDQYSKVKCYTGGGGYHGVQVRAADIGDSANDGYIVYTNTGGRLAISKVIDGVGTTLALDEAAIVNVDGSVMELRAIGTTIQSFYGGPQYLGDQTDAALTSGSAGIISFGSILDDWEGGAIGSTPAAVEQTQTYILLPV